MTFLAGLFLPGKRTITLSIFCGILAVIMQADSQGLLHLAPMLKISVNMLFSLAIPFVPVYLRKAYQNALNEKANG